MPVVCMENRLLPTFFRPDEDGDTLLQLAVIQGDDRLLSALLQAAKEYHVDINCRNKLSQSALHLSVITSNACATEQLIRAGASLSLTNSKGFSAIHLAVEHSALHCLNIMLTLASQQDVSSTVNAMDYDGYTALHRAVMRADITAIRMLLSAGANVNAADGKSGRTALFHAAEANRPDLCNLLLAEGCADVHAANYSGVSPVYAASGRRLVQVVAVLVRYGADVCLPGSTLDRN